MQAALFLMVCLLTLKQATNGDTKNHFDLVNWCEKTKSKIIVGGQIKGRLPSV